MFILDSLNISFTLIGHPELSASLGNAALLLTVRVHHKPPCGEAPWWLVLSLFMPGM